MSNPITESYFQSDSVGQFIFLCLGFLSIVSWALIIYRFRLIFQARRADAEFLNVFEKSHSRFLSIALEPISPISAVFDSMRSHTLELLNKNRQFGAVEAKTGSAYLSMDDIHMIAERASAQVQKQLYELEEYIHHLSTIVALAPFLGLFGTVWGILTSFYSMTGTSSLSSQTMFVGLSMALGTTVVGLIVAMPALVGYNAMRGSIRRFEAKLDDFSSRALSLIELQYRKVDKETS